MLPKQSELKQLFLYNPDTGQLYWKKTGKPAGGLAKWYDRARWRVRIKNKMYMAHRVIWALVYGDFDPKLQIDHIDHDPTNNKLDNLRLATRRENTRNRRLNKNNLSGKSGVTFSEKDKKWRANIGGGKSLLYLGSFDTREEAIAARHAAERIFAYHPNHGLVLTPNAYKLIV